MDNENEVITQENDTETTENQTGETTPEIDVEALKKENATLQAQKEHWRKKAETKVETEVKVETPKDDLSTKELYALIEAKVPKEDVEFITQWAKFNKIGVVDALNQKEVKSILALKSEERTSAEVANTTGGRRVTTKDTGMDLVNKFNQGQLPAEEDIEKMINARFEARKNRNK